MKLLNDFFEIVIIPFVEFVAIPIVFVADLIKGGAEHE